MNPDPQPLQPLETVEVFLPGLWAEKTLAPLLHQAAIQPREPGTLLARISSVPYNNKFAYDAPENANVGRIFAVLCIVPGPLKDRMQELVIKERERRENEKAKRASKCKPQPPETP
jgi:predicted phosphatase